MCGDGFGLVLVHVVFEGGTTTTIAVDVLVEVCRVGDPVGISSVSTMTDVAIMWDTVTTAGVPDVIVKELIGFAMTLVSVIPGAGIVTVRVLYVVKVSTTV